MNRRSALRRTVSISACALALLGQAKPAFSQSYDLLPLLDVIRNENQPSLEDSPVGGYVRFWVERVQDPRPLSLVPGEAASGGGQPTQETRDTPRDYRQEERNPIERYLWGRTRARILQAKLVITRSRLVTQSVTLASASHDSSRREGESWRSELGERRFLTPYFRVDQGSTAAIEVTLSTSRETDSAITRNLLSLVQTGARLVAPATGPLVTSLNSERFNQATNFVDTAISQLFRERLVEVSQNDFPAEFWQTRRPATAVPSPTRTEMGDAVMEIRARFPMRGHLWTSEGQRNLGAWRIYVTSPIVSIFSNVPWADQREDSMPCPTAQAATARKPGQTAAPATPRLSGHDLQACRAFRGLQPSYVLGMFVSDNLTLGDSIRADAGITAALQRYPNENDRGKRDDAAREICVLVAQRAEAIGLNPYDGAAALWAFASQGGVSSDLAGRLWNGDCNAAQLARRIGLELIVATPTQAAPQTQNPQQQPQSQEQQPQPQPTVPTTDGGS